MSDYGIIQNSDLLPIQSFHYGPLVYDLEQANATIGRIVCSGLKDTNSGSFVPIVDKTTREINLVSERLQVEIYCFTNFQYLFFSF